VPRPPGCKPVRAKWVYKVKLLANGSVECYKAHWVAKGYNQRFGIDYDQKFAPVMRMENLCTLLAIACILNLDVQQMDVDLAFLQAELKEEIYIDQPEGFEDEKHPEWVCLLLCSLYGLKQAPCEWNKMIDKHLCKFGFLPTAIDPCIYVKVEGCHPIYIAIYVDDCVIVAQSEHMSRIKRVLSDCFKMKDLGVAKSVLSLEVMHDWNRGTISI